MIDLLVQMILLLSSLLLHLDDLPEVVLLEVFLELVIKLWRLGQYLVLVPADECKLEEQSLCAVDDEILGVS